MAERTGAEADRCTRGPDHRRKGRHRNCAAQNPQDCECEPQVNLRRRHFLGSSLLVFGSTLMDALTTPLWQRKLDSTFPTFGAPTRTSATSSRQREAASLSSITTTMDGSIFT